ncbi:ribosome silencing factor [Vagococcus lutrae]|uniref:ribosome silencing factor n=1 Tax=Vagococcus lutrae TaxID=81947 RepID=UPI001C97155B|nr:ribosome silencing factor [Vagococcus lutrae]QZN89610.1 ribosome silencing factor [Vagococcus lutrae]
MDSQNLLELVVKAADDKRAEDIVALDVQKVSLLADYFVICHGNSEKQVAAIIDGISEKVHEAGAEVGRIEGKDGGKWVLADLGDVIVHVFHHEERSFYNLEKLWSDAPLVNLNEWVS